FGAASNALKPKVGGTYALLATGPATGTSHSQDIGGGGMNDPYAFGGQGGSAMHNAVEWRLHLKAPAGANGLRFRHVFFSEEYDDYVGSNFNDKFYAVLEAGSTNGGTPTVVNYTDCRAPDSYADFVCSPGMQFCNPRARYC
ncbi:MAG: choice-of-anchor L domain-containing protein, partial [Deltaproteobacteria bacterium]|nr:choice-of-anchor L domain-containing protein [Deltaproteobacteria bacterium]